MAKTFNLKELTTEEEQVIDTLRNDNYCTIKILKNKGEIDIIEGVEKIRDNDQIKEILNQYSYQNIEIIQTKNRIVHINRTVRIKAKVKN